MESANDQTWTDDELGILAEISKVKEENTYLHSMSSSSTLELDRSSLASSEWEQLSVTNYGPSMAAREDLQNQNQHPIRLPTETWAGVFKFLSRHILLNQVQPTCRRFHVIADRKVDNVHLISNFDYFLDGLARNLPIANKQKAELMASDASLAKHFRLVEYLTFYLNRQTVYNLDREKRRRLAQMCVLRHSLELFRGCRLQLVMASNSNEYLDYLSLLQLTRPFSINFSSYFVVDVSPELQMDNLLRMPIMLSCPWVAFYQANVTPSNADSICKWLHHLPIQQQDEKEQEDNRTRIFNLKTKIMPNICAEIIECCKKSLLQSELLTDRRSFLLIFISSTQLVPFHIEHPPTGEVLQLKSFPHVDWDEVKNYYHLRRCPIADLATTDHFYRDAFEYDPPAEGLVAYDFRAPVKDGLVAPHLQIH